MNIYCFDCKKPLILNNTQYSMYMIEFNRHYCIDCYNKEEIEFYTGGW